MGTKDNHDALKFQNFLNRNEASDLLGCSQVTLINWERKGLLHPVMASQGGNTRLVYLYDPAELARLPRKKLPPLTPGEIESRAFDLFERGHSVRRVVIDLRVTAEEAWAIRERWLDAGATGDGPDMQKPQAGKATKRTIEIDADVHAGASDAELEDGIEAALDAAAPDVAT